ncbi:hypothetical protein LINGRAPRIM_LOCUS1029 [Linum grandiflorum]
MPRGDGFGRRKGDKAGLQTFIPRELLGFVASDIKLLPVVPLSDSRFIDFPCVFSFVSALCS